MVENICDVRWGRFFDVKNYKFKYFFLLIMKTEATGSELWNPLTKFYYIKKITKFCKIFIYYLQKEQCHLTVIRDIFFFIMKFSLPCSLISTAGGIMRSLYSQKVHIIFKRRTSSALYLTRFKIYATTIPFRFKKPTIVNIDGTERRTRR